jgi:DNA-binding NarL/FixJ family response regulator
MTGTAPFDGARDRRGDGNAGGEGGGAGASRVATEPVTTEAHDRAHGPTPVRLMLVDDHPLVRDGLRVRLEAEPGFVVVAEAGDSQGARTAAREHAPDLVLMDIAMKGDSGIDATRALVADHPGLRVIMLSMHDDAPFVAEALRAGARGYLLKDSPVGDIVDAIHRVMSGHLCLSRGLDAAACADEAATGRTLTRRENEVLALIAEGLSSRDIGERLSMGVRTVETHRLNLRRKLDLPSHAALVRYAVEQRMRRKA